MKLILSAPSKTFLLGEYAAMLGHPALILNTQPYFELHIERGDFRINGIEPQSPAGKFISNFQDIFAGLRINFIDPHQLQGGLGASSAQFLLIYSLSQTLQTAGLDFAAIQDKLSLLKAEQQSFIQGLLKTYLEYAWNGEGLAPSGADLIGQFFGKLTWVDNSTQMNQCFNWPFAELSWVLLRTGTKVATHQHLKQLANIPGQAFAGFLNLAWQGLQDVDAAKFIQAVKGYAEVLSQHGYVIESTQNLLAKLSKLSYILVAKGCGALGADIVLCIVDKRFLNSFYHWLEQQHIDYLPSTMGYGMNGILATITLDKH